MLSSPEVRKTQYKEAIWDIIARVWARGDEGSRWGGNNNKSAVFIEQLLGVIHFT